ncbi:hypothetical protein ACHAWU_003856 [Discostella pseudostelligera]|uniref:Uncharacterized protein n=1 Tax=Discostella pseudostelligera TaxID=259834 RepID=A0ABD3MK47_9STRA
MKELKDELERVTAEKDALKDELERVIAAKDALLTAQSAANGADELNAVTRKEFDDLSKQLAEMNEKISSLETIIRNDMEEVEQTVFVKTVDIEEELKQLGASIDATYKLRDEVADMKVYLKAKVEPLDERLSSLGAMVRNDVEELEKKFTRRLAATNDDVDLLMEKVEMTRSANIDRHDFAKELELAGDADDLLDKENSKALAGENHELLMMHGKTPKNYKTPNNKATVNTPRQSPGYSAPTKCSTLRGDQRLKSVLATSSEQNSSVSSTLKYNTHSTKQA